MSTDLTEEELEMVAELQTSEPHEVAAALRQLRAKAARADNTQLQEDYAEFCAENAEDMDHPGFRKELLEVDQRLARRYPQMPHKERWGKARRIVIDNGGDARSRDAREMGRVRSLGSRGMANPNRILDDDAGGGRISDEVLAEEECKSDWMDGIAKIKIGRQGRTVYADPEYGSKQVRQQREARVAERQQAEREE